MPTLRLESACGGVVKKRPPLKYNMQAGNARGIEGIYNALIYIAGMLALAYIFYIAISTRR